MHIVYDFFKFEKKIFLFKYCNPEYLINSNKWIKALQITNFKEVSFLRDHMV